VRVRNERWVSGKIIERGCIVVRDRNSVALL